MEVTRANFQEVLEELDGVLEDASFLAIDSEFTGLNSGPEPKPFDTPAQYYSKMKSGSADFLMVQFGLSVFTHNAKSDKYTQRSYNFYVFPRPMNRSAPDCRFMCQASSIAFLSDNGFDFNKLFNSGIPYLTNAEEERLSKKLEEKQKVREDGLELIPISDDDKPQIDEICTKIDEFLASDADELAIDRCNAFIRRLIHQEARMRWPNKIRLQAKTDGGMQFMMVSKMGTKEEESRKDAERKAKEKQEIKNAVGLSLLLRKISNSGKPIVGHNMVLDLCHIIHQFFGQLPDSYREFKSLVHGLFPRLFDTKLICKAPELKEKVPTSVLNTIVETVCKEPFTIPEIESVEGRSYSLASDKFHEAGYDAYATGLCFIALSNYLGSLQQSECSTVLCDSPILRPFLNKLLLVRLKDFEHIDLVGNDPMPSRDHVFHITFPKFWKLSDISQLFTPFGGVHVSWLTEETAYAALHKRDQSSSIIKKLQKNKRMKNCKIQTYAEYQRSIDDSQGKVDRKQQLPHGAVGSTNKESASKTAGDSANGVEDNGGTDVWETVSGNPSKIMLPNACHQREAIHSESSWLSATRARFKGKNCGGDQVDFCWGPTQTCSTSTYNVQQQDCPTTDKNTKKLPVEGTVRPPTETSNDGTRIAATSRYTLLRRTHLEPADLSNPGQSSASLENGQEATQNSPRTPESTPTTSPRARKRCTRKSPAILASSVRALTIEASKNNSRKSRIVTKDDQHLRKGLNGGKENDSSSDKIELKRPTNKLLMSGKKKSESVFTFYQLFRYAQRAFFILIAIFILVTPFYLDYS